MAKIPFSGVPTVAPIGAPSVYQSGRGGTAAAFGALEGQAAEQGAAGLGQFSDALAKHAMFMQQRVNEAEAKELFLTAGQDLSQLTLWHKNLEGKDAAAKLPEYMEKAKKLREDYRAKASNTEVARAFDNDFSRRLSFSMENQAGWAASQLRVYEKGMNEGIIKDSFDNMAKSADNEKEWSYWKDQGLAAVQKRGEMDGQSDEQIAHNKKVALSDAVQTRLEILINKDPLVAERLYVNQKDQLTGKDQAIVEGKLRSAVNNLGARVVGNSVYEQNKNKPVEALIAAARSQASSDRPNDIEFSDAVVGDVTRRYNAEKALHQDEKADVEDRYQRGLVETNYTGAQKQVTEAEIRSTFRDNPTKANRMIENLRNGKTFYAAAESAKLTSPAEDELLLRSWRPGNSDPSPDNAQRYEALVRVIGQKQRALKEDPGGYVIQNDPGVQAAFADAAANPKLLPKALERSAQAQDGLGIPGFYQRYLGKAQAEGQVKKLLSLRGEDLANSMQVLQGVYGNKWPQVLRELEAHKLPDELSVLGTIRNPVTRVELANLLTNEREKPGSTKKLAGESAKDVDAAVTEELAQFSKTLSFAPNGTVINSRYENGAKLLAYNYIGGGENTKDAARKAAQNLILSQYDFNYTARAPKGFLAPAEMYGGQIKAGIGADDIAPIPARPGETLTQQQIQERYLGNVKRGFWVTNENDNGWILLDDGRQPVLRKDGKRVEFFFDSIPANLGSAAPIVAQP